MIVALFILIIPESRQIPRRRPRDHSGRDRKDAATSQGMPGAPRSWNILPFGRSAALLTPCLWTGSVQNCEIANSCCWKAPRPWSFATATLGPQRAITALRDIPHPIPAGPPCWLRRKRIHLRCRRPRFDPWVRRIPWRRVWLPTPVFLPGESPWTEEPGGLQSTGSQRVGHDGETNNFTIAPLTRTRGLLVRGADPRSCP